MIHPTACIHPRAQVDPTTDVGPYTVIDEGVIVGPDCRIGPHVYLTGVTRIGAANVFHAGCVIGNTPQDLKYRGAPSRTRIGDRNTFRENVTVNRATDESEDTVIGSHNLLMAGAHVAHNCTLGNHVILANGVLLAGHVLIHDRAILSGNCLVHQFTRIGTFAMMQGGAGISQDLPPYTLASGKNTLCGLNTVGLRRAGFTTAQRLELRQLYHLLFRSGHGRKEAVARAREQYSSAAALVLIDFVGAAKRGTCSDPGRSSQRRASGPAEDESGE